MTYCPTLLKMAVLTLKLAALHDQLGAQLAHNHDYEHAREEFAVSYDLRDAVATVRRTCPTADSTPASTKDGRR